ncbi:hypothetical protein D9M68_767960 [compost metagenome]
MGGGALPWPESNDLKQCALRRNELWGRAAFASAQVALQGSLFPTDHHGMKWRDIDDFARAFASRAEDFCAHKRDGLAGDIFGKTEATAIACTPPASRSAVEIWR